MSLQIYKKLAEDLINKSRSGGTSHPQPQSYGGARTGLQPPYLRRGGYQSTGHIATMYNPEIHGAEQQVINTQPGIPLGMQQRPQRQPSANWRGGADPRSMSNRGRRGLSRGGLPPTSRGGSRPKMARPPMMGQNIPQQPNMAPNPIQNIPRGGAPPSRGLNVLGLSSRRTLN